MISDMDSKKIFHFFKEYFLITVGTASGEQRARETGRRQ